MGIAELDNNTNTITIKANLYFYGNAANAAISQQICNDINLYWNILNAHAIINERGYGFILNTTGIYKQFLTPKDVIENTNPLNNFFRIEEKASENISFVDGVGSNTGYFQLNNLLNNSSTAAHEFGHTLGLEHPEVLDIRGQGTPGIMYPRGTIVDANFQYDPHVEAGAYCGTMNPVHRKVLQKDIDDLHLEKLHFKNTIAVVGAFTSVWHNAHL
ncbi:MAG: peptidase M10 [Ferruginibacter sp.]|nr:peptidase M10 [Ferruginibacter sp.]